MLYEKDLNVIFSNNGQVHLTVPKKVVEAFGLEKGVKAEMTLNGEKIELRFFKVEKQILKPKNAYK
jgi:bifunctional DNA-binding transcriptional regulator/antitoxin component of YhaV-PrlF toxin-antitoxin module